MTDQTPSAETRRAWFSTMVRIRDFEDKVQELFMSGAIGGTTHLCQGQEAVSVGSIAAMRPGDVQTNTYRGHGEALALGVTPQTAFAGLMGKNTGGAGGGGGVGAPDRLFERQNRGKTTGGSGGVGGSMHLIDFSKGNIGANAIVGAGLPIAVGAAVGFQMQKRPNVALSFFGDGATNIGTFHEALNMAAVWKAPVVFIIANNLYGEYSPLLSTTPIADLARRADPYDFPGIVVDGQDVDTVHAALVDAAERARGGGGPTLLEMKTYRYRGHSRSDPAKYRPDGELDAWKGRDPIEILGAKLASEGLLSAADQARVRETTQQEIDAAAERAAAAPYPTLEETERYVYA